MNTFDAVFQHLEKTRATIFNRLRALSEDELPGRNSRARIVRELVSHIVPESPECAFVRVEVDANDMAVICTQVWRTRHDELLRIETDATKALGLSFSDGEMRSTSAVEKTRDTQNSLHNAVQQRAKAIQEYLKAVADARTQYVNRVTSAAIELLEHRDRALASVREALVALDVEVTLSGPTNSRP